MATQVWNPLLPQLLDQDGFQKMYGNTTITSNNQNGPPKKRRVSTRPNDMYQTSMTIQAGQEEILWDYFNTSLNGGVTYFRFIDPIDNIEKEWQFVGEPVLTPKGFETYKVGMQWLLIGAWIG